jgi:hypothetical protein
MRTAAAKAPPKALIDIDEAGIELYRRAKGRGRVPAGYTEQPDGNFHRLVRTGATGAARSPRTHSPDAPPYMSDDIPAAEPPPQPSGSLPRADAAAPAAPTLPIRDPLLLRNPPPLDPAPWQPDRLPSSWVVFSDLHVSRATLAVCLRVLAAVREEAARRGAGVIFLGDFWQERGALRVEPLNAGRRRRLPAAGRPARAAHRRRGRRG